MDFSLNTNSAKNFGGSGSSFISESGCYVGKLLRASDRISKSGTKGLDLMFKSSDGATADYITIWHTKADGTALSGLDSINALLTCLKLRGAACKSYPAPRWDKVTKKYAMTQEEGYPDLLNKDVGICLQMTREDDGQGGERTGKQIIGWYEASSELTAREILDKATKAESVQRTREYLAKVPVKDLRKAPGAAPKPAAAPAAFGEFDDDLLF